MRKCPLSKNELQQKRAEFERTGINRQARRKSRKTASSKQTSTEVEQWIALNDKAVKPVVAAKKD